MRIDRRASCGWVLGALALVAPAPARSTPPREPLEIRVTLEPGTLRWTLAAACDLAIVTAQLATVPPAHFATAALPGGVLAAGDRVEGVVRLDRDVEWAEIVLRLHTATGEMTLGGSARRFSSAGPPEPLSITLSQKPSVAASVHARCLYEQRLVGPAGYTGTVQQLPLRRLEADLVDASTDSVLVRGSVSETGDVTLVPPADWTGTAVLQLLSWTRTRPDVRLAVLDPEGADALIDARPHAFRSDPFEIGAAAIDLGTLVLRDPDGLGRVQAFHILDLAFDAWDALAAGPFLGRPPALEDSLVLLWGPQARIRSTAYGNGLVEVASPGSGDTDAWSDGIVLHEIGHHVGQRFLRDSSPGGIHLLGDVEQELQLAWAEGLATAFSCWVRAHRAATRRNEAGEPIDPWPALFANAGLPPPGNLPGGLQYAWDVEAYTLGGAPLAKDGTGSEVNVAGVLWDATDGALPARAARFFDDDPLALGVGPVFAVLRAMRDLPAGTHVTFEDFWRTWEATSGATGALAPLLAQARIEYFADDFEPDANPAPPLDAWVENEAPGGVVLAEIHPGPRIAVEIANRGDAPVDLGGWSLVARSNTSSGNPALTYTIPPGVSLGPGARLVVWKGGRPRDNSPRDLYANNWTVPWFPRFEGACTLFDAAGRGIDFVRWSAVDGTASVTPPPAGVGWRDEIEAPDFGASLQRHGARVDADVAADFEVRSPTLGTPNGLPALHRTFFPGTDVDRTSYRAPSDGVYTVLVRGLRSGAAPELEIETASGPVRASARAGEARLTLRLAPGEEITARLVQSPSAVTELGSYDIAYLREPDAGLPLPPVGIETAVQLEPASGRVLLDWRGGAVYDSMRVRADAGDWIPLPGDARHFEFDLPHGRHRIELAGVTRGVEVAAPPLIIAVEPWPASFAEPFDALPAAEWETSGTWGTTARAGRNGVLASSPAGPYVEESFGITRQRSAVAIGPATQLRLVHACIVRPEDGARVEVSADWGATWTPLARFDWNAHRGQGEIANWRDGSVDSTDWVEDTFDLSAWNGRPLQLRFVFESDFFGNAAGWFIDALRIETRAVPLPPEVQLDAAFPNPFNPGTTLRFALPAAADVQLRIHDARGRVVRNLLQAWFEAGSHTVRWDARDAHGERVASGIYFARLQAAGAARTRKLTVLH